MKVVILAGGAGTRLAEETAVIPKPMIEIGGKPLLWHILKYYSAYGFRDFAVALGYKGESIKRYFLDYPAINRSFRMQLQGGSVEYLDAQVEDWTIDLVDTGIDTATGGRLKRLQPLLKPPGEPFCMTYGDGLSTVDLHALLRFHRQHGCLVTLTAVHPPARFGGLDLDGDRVVNFAEKSQIRAGWINGGFMVMEPQVLDEIEGDQTVLEADLLPALTERGQVRAFCHEGFWQCMDTLRDKRYLQELWDREPPWKIW